MGGVQSTGRRVLLQKKSAKKSDQFTWRPWLRAAKQFIYIYSTARVIQVYGGDIVHCSGPSMQPTILDGDIVITEKMSKSMGNLKRGDLVTVTMKTHGHQLICKRLALKEHDVIDPSLLAWSGDWKHRVVPKGHVYLLGDNPSASADSRDFGPVPEGLVFSRLVYRIWPPNRTGWLSTHWFYE